LSSLTSESRSRPAIHVAYEVGEEPREGGRIHGRWRPVGFGRGSEIGARDGGRGEDFLPMKALPINPAVDFLPINPTNLSSRFPISHRYFNQPLIMFLRNDLVLIRGEET
jgi:hypothetical protein